MLSIGNNTLADEIVRSTSAKQAKSIANSVPFSELDDWNSKTITVMKDILFAKWTACAPFRRALLNTRGLHIIEGTIDQYWGAGVSRDIATTMHPDHLKGRNVLGTLLVELRGAMTTEDSTATANATATPTNPLIDQSAAKTFTLAASSEAPMDQTNSQPDLPTLPNSTEQPMMQPICQSALSAPETTNPPLGPESVNSTTHAAPTPNPDPSALEPVTTQTASSVNKAADDPPLVSPPPLVVSLTKETVADSSIESTITDFVTQTESLPADQPKNLTSPPSNSTISAPPDGGSDKDTAITHQEGAHPTTPNTPPRLNTTQTIDPTDTPTRTFRKPRRPSVHPRCERSSSMPPRPDVLLPRLQTIDDMFAKELLKKRKSSTTPSMEKRAQLDEVIKLQPIWMHPGCLISLTRLSPMELVIMVLSIVFIQAPVSQRSKLLGRYNQIFMIPNLTQCFRKSTIYKYLSCNYLYLSCIKCIVILPIFILLSHTSTSTCIALKALISYPHTHTVHTLYYYMYSFHSISYSIHLLAMEPHAFYIKCNYIKISNMSLLYIQLAIPNISYPNISMKSTRCVLSVTLFSAYNFMRSCIQIVSINKCIFLNDLNSFSTITGERILIVTHTKVAYCVCIHISQ